MRTCVLTSILFCCFYPLKTLSTYIVFSFYGKYIEFMCNEICYIKKSRNHFYFNNGIAALSQSICIGLKLEQAESIPIRLAKLAQELLEEHKRLWRAWQNLQLPRSRTENPTICSQVSISKTVGDLQRSYI